MADDGKKRRSNIRKSDNAMESSINLSGITREINELNKSVSQLNRNTEQVLNNMSNGLLSTFRSARKELNDIANSGNKIKATMGTSSGAGGSGSGLGNLEKKRASFDKSVDEFIDNIKKTNSEERSALSKKQAAYKSLNIFEIKRYKQEVALEKKLKELKDKASEELRTKGSISDDTKNSLTDVATKLENSGDILESAGAKVVDIVGSGIKEIASQAMQIFREGMADFSNAYEQTFTNVAGRLNVGSRSELNKYYDSIEDGIDDVRHGLKASDAIASMNELASTGVREDLSSKAISMALDKKVVPWLSETSDTWLSFMNTSSKDAQNTIKGQAILIGKSDEGNRFVQSGLYSALLDQIAPILSNIDYNTGGASNLTGDAAALYEYMTKSAEEGGMGLDSKTAWDTLQQSLEVIRNPGTAVQNGNVTQKLQGIEFSNGGNLFDMFEASMIADTTAANTGSNLGASLVTNAWGGTIQYSGIADVETRQDVVGRTGTALDNARKQAEVYNNDKKALEAYTAEIKKASEGEYDTATTEYQNLVTSYLDQISSTLAKLPFGTQIGGVVGGVLAGVAKAGANSLAKKAIGSIIGKSTGGSAGSAASELLSGSAGGGSGALSGIGSGAKALGSVLKTGLTKGGITVGGASSATAVAAGIAGIAAGGIMATKDAINATKKADDWGVSKGSAGVAGALFGSEDAPSLKNTARQTAKYAAIGAGIGSFIPGVGTAVGAGVGALAGAISSVVSGRQVAQAVDKAKDKIKEGVTNLSDKIHNSVTNTKEKLKNFAGEQKDNFKEHGLIGGTLNNITKSLFGEAGSDKLFNKEELPESSLSSILKLVESINDKIPNNSSRSSRIDSRDPQKDVSKVLLSSASIASSLIAGPAGELLFNSQSVRNLLNKNISNNDNEEDERNPDEEFHERLINVINDVGRLVAESVENVTNVNMDRSDSRIINNRSLLKSVAAYASGPSPLEAFTNLTPTSTSMSISV